MKTGRTRTRATLAGAARAAVGHRDSSRFYAPPAELAAKPDWLRLGARVLYLERKSARCAIGMTLTIVGIRPTAGGWELLSSSTANRWFNITEVAVE